MEKYDYHEQVYQVVEERLSRTLPYSPVILQMGPERRTRYVDCLWNEFILAEFLEDCRVSEEEAWENLKGNLELLADAMHDDSAAPEGCDLLLGGAEECDMAIRIHLLRSCIEEYINDYCEDFKQTASGRRFMAEQGN